MKAERFKKLETTFIIAVSIAVFLIALAATSLHLYALSGTITEQLKEKALILARTFQVSTLGSRGLPPIEEMKREMHILDRDNKEIKEIELVVADAASPSAYTIATSTNEAEIGQVADFWYAESIRGNRVVTLLEITDRSTGQDLYENEKERIKIKYLLRAMREPRHEYLWEVILPLNDITGATVGGIVVEISLDEAVTQLIKSGIRAFLMFLGSLVVLLTIIVVATRRLVIRPIDSLGDAIETVKEGDFSYNLPITRQDEIGRLAGSFNEMVDSLRKSREEVNNLNRSLQHRVEQATAELQGTNRELTGKIAELQQTQQKLLRSERYTASALMAAGIAHEIRGPLSSMKYVVHQMEDVLKSGGEEQEQGLTELHEAFNDEAKKLDNLANAFLDYTRPVRPQMAVCQLSAVLDVAMDTVVEQRPSTAAVLKRRRDDVPTRGAASGQRPFSIAVEKTYDGEVPPLLLDRKMMQRAFENLINNAAQSMPEGGIIRIKTSLDAKLHRVIVTISDTGMGIDEHQLAQIFDPFFTTRSGGVGLGLPIVERIVEAHGGRISVSSTPGAGTTFEIELDTGEYQ